MSKFANDKSVQGQRVIVIGGGLSGLSAVHTSIQVFEQLFRCIVLCFGFKFHVLCFTDWLPRSFT